MTPNPCCEPPITTSIMLRRLTATPDDTDLDVWHDLIDYLKPSEEVSSIFWRRIHCGADESAVIGLVEHTIPSVNWLVYSVPTTGEHGAVVLVHQATAHSPALALAAALVTALEKGRNSHG